MTKLYHFFAFSVLAFIAISAQESDVEIGEEEQYCAIPQVNNGQYKEGADSESKTFVVRDGSTLTHVKLGGHIVLECSPGFKPLHGQNRSYCMETWDDVEWKPPTTQCQRERSFSPCGVGYRDRVIGGSEVELGELPWMARLDLIYESDSENDGLCGGVLIDPQWILTAAHCMSRKKVASVVISLGRVSFNQLFSLDGVKRTPVEIITHPEYDAVSVSKRSFDFSLIKLNRPVVASETIRPICLPSQCDNSSSISRLSEVYDSCMNGRERISAAGWGFDESGQLSSNLKSVNLTLYSRRDCWRLSGIHATAQNICAGSRRAGQDTCGGDSGGPLMCTKNGKTHLLGIVSFGPQCGAANQPGVYGRVCSVVEWINSTIRTTSRTPTTTQTTTLRQIITQAPIIWQPHNWAMACDFPGRDLFNVKVRGEECGPLCASTNRCTHFSWTTYEGGTCWLKTGSVSKEDAFRSPDSSMVCGFLDAQQLASKDPAASAIVWQLGNWAYACDFQGNNLANVTGVPGEQCGPLCRQKQGCTHFTHTTYQGGTCWMKQGQVTRSDAFATRDWTMVCGLN